MDKRQDEGQDRLEVLLLADEQATADRIETLLAEAGLADYQIHLAGTLDNGMEALDNRDFDIALLNPAIPGGSGLESIRTLKQKAPWVPIIVLDDTQSADRFQTATQFGAHDYFYDKEIYAHDLAAAINTAVESNRRQKRLSRNEKKFRGIIENLEDAYYETDLDGRFTYVNDTLCQHLQQPREALIGQRRQAFSSPDSNANLERVFQEVLATGAVEACVEDKIVRRDGSTLHLELSVMLMRNPQGQPVGFCSISRDVTEKKNTEKELKISEEKYRNIIASIEDGYFEVDLEGNFVFVNDAMTKISGYTRDELLTTNNRDVMDSRNADIVAQANKKMYRTGNPNRYVQYEVIHKDGTKRQCESAISLIPDNNGNPVGFRGLVRDITERNAAELALARAKVEAEAATQAKSDFLANMSHEIRTPLNGILGMYNLLLATDLNAEQADFVETGKRSSDSLLAVINDILDFSKIEAGTIDIESVDFDLRKAVEEISALPAMQAYEKGLEFICRIDPNVPSFLKGDPGRLRQIIINLCTNAIKFTKNGEIVLTVDLLEDHADHAKLCFTVRDTGIGISEEDQARLFQSFQQVDAATTRKYGGTGLGLAISKKLTELMGGEIGVESRIHEGSTFWFNVTFDKQEGTREYTFEVPEALTDQRILIVDDSKANLDILSLYLQHWGCDCDRAISGETALSLMHAVARAGKPYDLMITDMRMPGMDGAELGRLIKADPGLARTRLVMLTNQGVRNDAARIKSIGFSAFLTKPVRRSQLFDCLMSVINGPAHFAPEPRTQPPKAPFPETPPEQPRNVRILLAEDNHINQKLALHLLKKFGFQADAVLNGRLAVQALVREDYDLVLMDIQMPEMDGLEATQLIRNPASAVRNHAIPIIAITAHAMKGDREKCLEAGMNDYVVKPVQPGALLKAIQGVLADKDSAEDADGAFGDAAR